MRTWEVSYNFNEASYCLDLHEVGPRAVVAGWYLQAAYSIKLCGCCLGEWAWTLGIAPILNRLVTTVHRVEDAGCTCIDHILISEQAAAVLEADLVASVRSHFEDAE